MINPTSFSTSRHGLSSEGVCVSRMAAGSQGMEGEKSDHPSASGGYLTTFQGGERVAVVGASVTWCVVTLYNVWSSQVSTAATKASMNSCRPQSRWLRRESWQRFTAERISSAVNSAANTWRKSSMSTMARVALRVVNQRQELCWISGPRINADVTGNDDVLL